MVKVRVYNISYEVYEYGGYIDNPYTEGYGMSQEEFDEYLEELQQDLILEIDPEDIGWSMSGTDTHMSIPEYIVDYITEEIGEGFHGYDYEVLVDLREVKLNLLGV